MMTAFCNRAFFHFLNTKWDHVDESRVTLRNVTGQRREVAFSHIQMSAEDLVRKRDELLRCGEHVEWSQNNTSLSKVWTTSDVYALASDVGDALEDMASTYGLNGIRLDHVNDNLASQFVLAGTHFNTHAMFNPSLLDQPNLRLIDIRQSYASFHKSRFYAVCKFPHELTRFAPTDRVMGPLIALIIQHNHEKSS
ncbi:hypothetical protein AB1Y20_021601 [Prymnesium parvum]|uniref:Uncharacterized protein n=1 Tax=Prymnesium parvum TaxID=97485 RepID=A0AB34JIQ7_PRYPA